MSTTLISNSEANGVGLLARDLARFCPGVNKVVSIRCQPAFPHLVKWPDSVQVFEGMCSEAENDKYIYFEEACGLSSSLQGKRIWVPMWEQASVAMEAQVPARALCITKHTMSFLRMRFDVHGEYLPWPVELPPTWNKSSSIKTILHNAGSFGANFRKGTLEAIEIFQRSGVVELGVQLIVHSWMTPPREMLVAVYRQPAGINLACNFEEEITDLYRGVDLLLLPTKMDGSPLQVVEAAAHGVPTLVTNMLPMTEAEDDPDYLIPVACKATSPLNAPYHIVDVPTGAEMLRKLCEMDMREKRLERRAFAESRRWNGPTGEVWREVCR